MLPEDVPMVDVLDYYGSFDLKVLALLGLELHKGAQQLLLEVFGSFTLKTLVPSLYFSLNFDEASNL